NSESLSHGRILTAAYGTEDRLAAGSHGAWLSTLIWRSLYSLVKQRPEGKLMVQCCKGSLLTWTISSGRMTGIFLGRAALLFVTLCPCGLCGCNGTERILGSIMFHIPSPVLRLSLRICIAPEAG